MEQYLKTIKQWLEEAETIVINTGAGMGRDSGLADYRGEGGQWGRMESETGQSIFDTVNPKIFQEKPVFAWSFFIQRMIDYQNATPHEGFSILLKWIERYQLDYFVLTSNIDGHFQKAGFAADKIRELHGSLAYFQSANPNIWQVVWKNERNPVELLAEVQAGNIPTCPDSAFPARPNVYMFRDNTYINTISKEQEARFQTFLARNRGKKMVVFEIGSGPHVQTIRMKTRMLKTDYNAHIIRINPKDFAIKPPHIGIDKGALETLQTIETYLTAA